MQSVSSRSSFNNIDKDGSIQDSEEMARVFIIQVSFYWDDLFSSFLISSYLLYLSLPHPVLTYPTPTRSCFTVSYIPYPTWFCFTVSYMILFYRILHDSVMTYPILSWRVVSCPILFYSTLVSTERFISNLFIIFLQFLKFPGPHIWYFNFSKAIEVTQSDVLKRGLNELLETLPGGGIVQVNTTLYFCNEWCGWCHLTVMLLLL